MNERWHVRAPLDADVPELVALLNACDEADIGHPDSDEEEAIWRWRTPGFDRERDAFVVVSGVDIVGYALVHGGLADVYVHPKHRGLGIGAELLVRVEERALEQAGPGVELKQNATDRATAARELLENAGYVRSHHYIRMEIDIPAEVEEIELPKGVGFRSFDPDVDARAFYDAYTQAWQQYEGQEWMPEGFEAWSQELEGGDFDPALWFLAEAEGRIVGFVQCFNFPGGMGWVHRLGTLPENRGRGIGGALMLRVFRAYRERGITRVGLTVSSRNLSSARALYERLGFREVLRIDNYRKTLGGVRE